MNYKNKIKNYRPEVDIEAWHAMESLLDKEALKGDSSSDKPGLLSKIRKWMFVVFIGAIAMAIGAYLMDINTNRDLSHSNVSDPVSKQSISTSLDEEEPGDQNIGEQDFNADASLSQNINIEASDKSNDMNNSINKDKGNESKKASYLNENEESAVQNPTSFETIVPDNENSTHNVQTVRQNSQSSGFRSDVHSKESKAELLLNQHEVQSDKSSNVNDEISGSQYTDANLISQNNRLELSSRLDSKLVDEKESDTEFNVTLNIEKLRTIGMVALYPISKHELIGPEFIKPQRILSKYSIGLDIGNAKYFNRVSGESISIFGVYEIWPWLRTGLRFNYTSMRDPINFTISPEIKQRKVESGIKLYTQIVPLRLWRINLGIEGGYGATNIIEKDRRLVNPEPNVINITEETAKYVTNWFYLGAHFTIDISRSIKVGMTIGTDTGTESVHTSGRLVYRI